MKHKVIWICAAWLTSIAVGVAGGYYYYWIQLYPQYLRFMDKLSVKNGYYDLELTSFVTNLWYALDGKRAYVINAYWRIFTCEENYNEKWNLEVFDRRWQENETVVWTISHTFTENITKRWQFWTDKPTFTVEIIRTYLVSGENTNNQIIIDVNNHGIHPIQQGIIYETEVGVFGYRILEATPNNITIQTGHPTETQLNFYGASDRILRYHAEGEVETVKLLVYANQFGSVNDVSW